MDHFLVRPQCESGAPEKGKLLLECILQRPGRGPGPLQFQGFASGRFPETREQADPSAQNLKGNVAVGGPCLEFTSRGKIRGRGLGGLPGGPFLALGAREVPAKTHDVDLGTLLAGLLVLPTTVVEAALDEDGTPLLEPLAETLGLLAEKSHIEEMGFILPTPISVRASFIDSNADLGHLIA